MTERPGRETLKWHNSYEIVRTRLHAKAWLFHRDSGLHTAYIGSSNLTHAAQVDGLEWNVRVSAAENPEVIGRFAATFEQYWQEPEFEDYEPGRDAERLDRALSRQGHGGSADDGLDISLTQTTLPLDDFAVPHPDDTGAGLSLTNELAREVLEQARIAEQVTHRLKELDLVRFQAPELRPGWRTRDEPEKRMLRDIGCIPQDEVDIEPERRRMMENRRTLSEDGVRRWRSSVGITARSCPCAR